MNKDEHPAPSPLRTPRLASPAALALLGLSLLGIFIGLAPGQSSERQRLVEHDLDLLSLTYLRLAVREAPDDHDLRLRLAQHYHEMSAPAQALRTLAPLLDLDTPAGHQARILAVQIEHARCARDAPDAAPGSCAEGLVARIRALGSRAHAAAPATLARVAELALAHGAPTLAGDLFAALASRAASAEERAAWRERGAMAYAQAGAHERAAALHAAMAGELPVTAAISHMERATQHLQAANRPADALELALATLARAPDRRDLLEMAIALALASEKPHLAASLGRRALALGPDDRASVQRQIELELAIGELERALPLAAALVARAPGDRAARERLAQIAEWSGRPLLALDHWAALARRHGDPECRERAMSLARALWDQELREELLTHALERRPPDHHARLELAGLRLRLGRVDDARAVAERVVATRPQHRPGWDALLDIARATADLHGVAAIWERVHAHLGTTEAEAREWAEALWRAQRPREALDVLVRAAGARPASAGDASTAAPPMSAAQTPTLHMIAELAWQVEALDRARDAYEALWRRQALDADRLERLILAARHTGSVTLALAVAEDTWQRTSAPGPLLLAMHAAAEDGRWSDVARLERLAAASPHEPVTRADYWHLRMARRQHALRVHLERGDLDQAQAIVDDLEAELARARAASPELAHSPDAPALLADLRQQRADVAHAQRERARVHRALARDITRQRVYVALARGDLDTARRWLPHAELPAVDHVHALMRLGHDERAIEVALHERHAAEPATRARLDAELETLTRRLSRQVSSHLRAASPGNGHLVELGAGVRHTRQAWAMGAVAAARRLETLAPVHLGPVHEADIAATAERRAPRSVTALELGASMRSQDLLPRVALAHTRKLGGAAWARVIAGVSQPADDHSALALHAVRDHVTADVAVGADRRVFALATLRGEVLRDRQRAPLLRGADVSATIGARARRGSHEASARLVAAIMPRQVVSGPGTPIAPEVPQRRWLALAAGLASGEPGVAATPVARLRYALELSAGWLWPDAHATLAAALRVGVPILGNDELFVAVELGHALPATPVLDAATTRRAIMLQYARSLWP